MMHECYRDILQDLILILVFQEFDKEKRKNFKDNNLEFLFTRKNNLSFINKDLTLYHTRSYEIRK